MKKFKMNKPPFSRQKAIKTATVSNLIEGYKPSKDKEVLKKVKEYLALLKSIK